MPNPGRSSCWISVEKSQFESRLPQPLSTFGSHTVAFGLFLPKLLLPIAPHSPLMAKLPRSQSGTKLPRRGSPTGKVRSSQLRLDDTTDVAIGLRPSVKSVPSFDTYFPSCALIAVRPLPNRS